MSGKNGALGPLAGILLARPAGAAPLTLVDQGNPRVCVVLPARAIPAKGAAPDPAFERHRAAADDLVHYLGKISGAKVEVGAAARPGLVPVYVGCAPGNV